MKMESVYTGVLNDFVDEISMEVVFQLHRAVKLGYYRELIDPESKNIIRKGVCVRVCVFVYGVEYPMFGIQMWA